MKPALQSVLMAPSGVVLGSAGNQMTLPGWGKRPANVNASTAGELNVQKTKLTDPYFEVVVLFQ